MILIPFSIIHVLTIITQNSPGLIFLTLLAKKKLSWEIWSIGGKSYCTALISFSASYEYHGLDTFIIVNYSRTSLVMDVKKRNGM